MSIESLLQKKNIKTEVLPLGKMNQVGIDKDQWEKFLKDDEIIDLGFFVEEAGKTKLYWVEKTTTDNLFNVRSTENSYVEYLKSFSSEFGLYLIFLIVVLIPVIFTLSILFLKPISSVRKISEDILAGNYDVEFENYTAKDDLGSTLVAFKKLAKDLKSYQEELEKVSELAIRDAMTGLKNHRAFKQAVHRELAMTKRNNKELGIVMLDVDKFKKFNDTYGHQQGDEVLKVVGKTLEETARASDFVARYGGEEFVLLFPETGEEGIFVACEKFRKAIEATKVPDINNPGKFLSVTASFGGVHIQGEDIPSIENEDVYKPFIEICDGNLYKAKDKGRNCSIVSGVNT